MDHKEVRIKNIALSNFRNFTSKQIEFDKKLVLFCGHNGLGKTNLMEGLSLTGKSAPLRKSDFEEMVLSDLVSDDHQKQFTVNVRLENHDFIENVAVNFDKASKKKQILVNGEILNKTRQGDLKNYLINFISLTPQLEQLFILGKSERREYLDKIVSDLNPDHQTRINNYQKLLRERLMILQKYPIGNKAGESWLNIVENKIVETGVAIASTRVEAIDFFNNAIESFASNFPKPILKIIGDIEEMILVKKAVEVEEIFASKLKENRSSDKESFRTAYGVHRCDFDAIFSSKNASAQRSSTGEQKSIMIGITLARAKISANYKNQPTILLFDEIVSHLDSERKQHLFDEIIQTNLQCFFSSTSKELIPEKYITDELVQVFDFNL